VSMTKREFKQYQRLPAEREYYIRRIERLEKQAEAVPVVKDKVMASQKDYPFIEMHVTVDAPEPVRYSSIQRDLIRARRMLKDVERRFDQLTRMITTIDDSRTRQIITMRYIDGESLKYTAIKFDLTEQHILRIVNDAIKNL